jgi:transposase
LEEVTVPEPMAAAIEPLVELLGPLEEQLAAVDKSLRERAEGEPVVRRLCGVVGIGPVTAAAYVAAIDDPHRFSEAGEVASYVGLVPRERSSGEQQRRGRITKAGNSRVRSLLVEAGWTVLRGRSPAMARLREWAERIAARRSKQVAAVALARRLARILYAMWRDGVDYKPEVLARGAQVAAA